jgi:uncharacterized protein with GYD domain
MPVYVCLAKWTQKGIENIKDSPSRLEAARKVAKSVGGEIKDFYYTMGRYDMVAVAECPDDEAATKFALTVAGAGAVRMETLPAIPATRAAEIIKGLP